MPETRTAPQRTAAVPAPAWRERAPRRTRFGSVRLWLVVGLGAALLLPALGVSLAAGARAMSGTTALVLAQTLALLAVLAAVWATMVRPVLLRALSVASELAGGRAAGVAAPRLGWRASRSLLDQLTATLNKAQQRSSALADELAQRHRDLHRMAMYDALTGLPNRRLFRDLLLRAAAQAKRANRPMALMFIDLDHFKEINDRHGHPAGDELLQCVAQRLSETMRGADLVGRIGGDEFVALLPDTAELEAVAHSALRIIRAIEVPVPLDGGRIQGQVSASIGVARYPRDGQDFETLLDHADQAMYRAKTLGRGRFVLFQPALDDEGLSAEPAVVDSDAALSQALDHDEMQLYFQPVIDTSSGHAVGAEALIRWRHPDEGVLLPSRFIRRAEASGQLHALEMRTLDQACAQLAQWKDMGLRPGRVSINVSAPEFRHAAWTQELGRAMERHDIRAGELAVELTESTLMGDVEAVRERLQGLRRLGVSLVIDDFGSGPISLARLGELRPAMVKLDAAFVQRLPDDAVARALVQGIVGLARSLGIALVAEGVETESQRDALAQLGCHLQQGYLFARPQPALPEPAWPLPRGPQDSGWPQSGANDSLLGDLSDPGDSLPSGMQPPRTVPGGLGGRSRLA